MYLLQQTSYTGYVSLQPEGHVKCMGRDFLASSFTGSQFIIFISWGLRKEQCILL